MIPLPALKPVDGRYVFCPACAAGWILVLVAVYFVYKYMKGSEK
jgi:hypothetical protein